MKYSKRGGRQSRFIVACKLKHGDNLVDGMHDAIVFGCKSHKLPCDDEMVVVIRWKRGRRNNLFGSMMKNKATEKKNIPTIVVMTLARA